MSSTFLTHDALQASLIARASCYDVIAYACDGPCPLSLLCVVYKRGRSYPCRRSGSRLNYCTPCRLRCL